MKLGCCLNLLAKTGDPAGVAQAAAVAAAGYDYVELPLAPVAALGERDFSALLDRLARAGIPCEACCNLFPPELRVTGTRVDSDPLRRYLDSAMGRARRLGAKVVVFGSPASRNVPEGFPREMAILQYIKTLQLLNGYAGDGLEIGIEHVCRLEGNLIYTVREARAIREVCGCQHVGILADTYHMAVEGESFQELALAGKEIIHVHTANPDGRIYPAPGDQTDYGEIIRALKTGGYTGRISVEAYAKNVRQDAELALKTLRKAGA